MVTEREFMQQRFGIDDGQNDAAASEIHQRILSRRSIRRFKKDIVDDALVRLLLACAQSAPAKSDLQQYSILHLTDSAAKEKLARLADTDWIAAAPAVLVFCGDIRRAQRISQMRGKPYAQNTLDSFMNAAVDAGLALQSFIIAAEAAGLGCCAVSQVRTRIDEVAALLDLPDGVFPVAGLAAGWPDEARDVTLRLPPAVVVHRNTYNDADLETEIAGYDARRHAAFPIPPRGQLHNDRYGAAEFYGWSEHAARRLSQPEGRETLRAFLEGRGFALS